MNSSSEVPGKQDQWLSEKERETFRNEFQEKEREVQRYIGVYLAGLGLVTGWIIGPQSKSLLEIALGNGGYNVYAFLVLVALNVIFISFLIYKSLIIHEINQFLTYLSPPESGFSYWESWRRSRQSATLRTRLIYTLLLAVLPASASFLILYGVWRLLRSDPQSLIDQLKPFETAVGPPHTAMQDERRALLARTSADQLRNVFHTAKFWFKVAAWAHLIPLWFFIENLILVNIKWGQINEVIKERGGGLSFKKLVKDPFRRSSTPGGQGNLLAGESSKLMRPTTTLKPQLPRPFVSTLALLVILYKWFAGVKDSRRAK